MKICVTYLLAFLLTLLTSANAASNSAGSIKSASSVATTIEASSVTVVNASDKTVLNEKADEHNDFLSAEWMLVYVTLGLALYTAKLYRATVTLGKDAKKTAERQSNLERPWLFMEGARIVRREGEPIQPSLINNWYISFKWRNVGRSPALVETCIVKIENKDNLTATPDYSKASPLICPATVATGVEFETNQIGPSPEKGVTNGKAVNLTVYGVLTYKELDGTLHHTGFAVDVSPHLPAFSSNANKEYEYFD